MSHFFKKTNKENEKEGVQISVHKITDGVQLSIGVPELSYLE